MVNKSVQYNFLSIVYCVYILIFMYTDTQKEDIRGQRTDSGNHTLVREEPCSPSLFAISRTRAVAVAVSLAVA